MTLPNESQRAIIQSHRLCPWVFMVLADLPDRLVVKSNVFGTVMSLEKKEGQG